MCGKNLRNCWNKEKEFTGNSCYIDKDPCDEFDEFFKEQHDSGEFGCHVLMAIASGIIGY